MKNRNIYLSGKQVSTTTNKSSSTTSYVTLRAGSDYLGVSVDTLNGNRKSPNPQQFSTFRSSYWQGSRLTVDKVTETTNTVNGVVGSYEAIGSVDSSLAQIAYNRCVNDFYEKMRGTVDLSVDLAQSGQVIRMLRQAADFRKHVITSGKVLFNQGLPDKELWLSREAKALGGKYLEWVYGWKPLAASIHGTIGNLGQTLDNMMSVQTFASESSSSSYTGPVPFGKPGGTVFNSARCMMKAEFKPPSGTVQNLALYTSLNPLTIAWELVPYSFVVDWFYDLGGYLRTMESAALYGSRFSNGFLTQGIMTETKASCSELSISANRSVVGRAESYSRKTAKSRTLMDKAPIPSRPRFKADLGSSRLLAAAALLSQGLNRPPR